MMSNASFRRNGFVVMLRGHGGGDGIYVPRGGDRVAERTWYVSGAQAIFVNFFLPHRVTENQGKTS